ncbi:S8 family serine peptidase [Marinobacterium sp. D7]|uniref:S8 family serine peptidase n=1 Tax=Marinobacterium ramblicola TaxID=2849041 RepID=UPI001C2DDCC9|nr:S8 family serine peptidase [Marinobacterium ramblicola]MBV1789669.1 S8 family serine peptidase [Marinobacterium ramblicola]
MSNASQNAWLRALLIIGLLGSAQGFAATNAPDRPELDPTGAPNSTEQIGSAPRPSSETSAGRPGDARDPTHRTPDPGSTPPAFVPREMQLLDHQLPSIPGRPASVASRASDLIKSEILVSASDLETANRQRQQLAAQDLRIKNRQMLGGLGLVLSIYRVPDDKDPDVLLAQLQQQWPEWAAEFNRRYRLQGSSGRQFARRMVALPDTTESGDGVRLAMLDAKVDTSHPALSHSKLELIDITGQDNAPSRHGTAVASLLVGRDMVEGALPEASLLAINIFTDTTDDGLQTRTDIWLRGLDRLMLNTERPSVVNMSFGGGRSELVAAALHTLQRNGIDLVAAAGNDGPDSSAMFPANQPGVIAVTSVDMDKRIARHAPQDEAITLAAPGVDIWAADLNARGYYASGTSFATPWVSAALALAKQRGETLETLIHNAEDLGEQGRDPVFGYGLVHLP